MAAVTMTTYAATGAAAMSLLGHAQHVGGAAPDTARLAVFGAAAGIAFVAWALAAGWNVLNFPAQRHSRFVRLRERLPTGGRPFVRAASAVMQHPPTADNVAKLCNFLRLVGMAVWSTGYKTLLLNQLL